MGRVFHRYLNADRILAILSIVLAIFFYRQSVAEPRPTFIISDEHAVVYSSSDAGPMIQVLDSLGNPVTSDVYLATITFWNSGKAGIDREDIRIPLRLKLSPVKRVLDAAVVRQTLPESTNFQVEIVPVSASDNSVAEVEFHWEHLDPDSAAVIQIMYESNEAATIELTGHIYQIPAEKFIDASAATDTDSWGYQLALIAGVFLPYIVIANRIDRFARQDYHNRVARFCAEQLRDSSIVNGIAFTAAFAVITILLRMYITWAAPKPPL